MADTKKETRFERSYETKLAVELFLNLKPDEIITHEDVSKAFGRDFGFVISNISSARRILRREHAIVIEAVRGIGWKRLNNQGVARSGSETRLRIQNAAHRGLEKLNCVDYENLPVEDRTEVNVGRSIFHVVSNVMRPRNVKALGEVVSKVQTELPIGKVLQILGVQGGGNGNKK